MSKVRRKPAPTFPYSPKYPHPDPADPFVPLKILRERAQSTKAPRPHHSGSLDSLSQASHGSQGYGSPQYLLSVSLEGLAQGSEVSPTPRSDAFDLQPPVRPWHDVHAVGYASDPTKPARPPRAKARPSRESRSYFADVDMPSAVPRQRRQGSDVEKPAEQEIPQRRRSRSMFVLSREESRPTDAPPSTPPKQDESSEVKPSKQYTYHDRQSHGYLYNEPEVQALRHMQSSETMDLRAATSAHSSTTPPMTPDDSTSLSSASLRNRSRSRSPPAPVPEVPKAIMQTIATSNLRPEPAAPSAIEAETPSNIVSADFPLLATPHNASTKASAQPRRSPPQPANIPSEPGPEALPDSAARLKPNARDARKQPKRTSIAVGRGRQMDPPPTTRSSPRQRSSSSLSSSSASSQNHQARIGISRGAARFGSSKPAESDAGVASRSKLVVPPKAKKSVSHLSHMSLGLSGLPNSPFPSTANNSATELSSATHSKDHSPEPPPRDPSVRRAATATAHIPDLPTQSQQQQPQGKSLARSQTQLVSSAPQPPDRLPLAERDLHFNGSTSRLLGPSYVNTLSIIESRSATSRDEASTDHSLVSTLPTIQPSPARSRITPLNLVKPLDSPLPPPPRTPSPEPLVEMTPDWRDGQPLSESPIDAGYDPSVSAAEQTPAETPVPMPAPFPLTPPNQYSDFPTPLPLPSVHSMSSILASSTIPVPPVPPLPVSARSGYESSQEDLAPPERTRPTTPQPPREPERPPRETRPTQTVSKPKYLTVPPPVYGSAQHETHLARRATAPARAAYESTQAAARNHTPPTEPPHARQPSPERRPVAVQHIHAIETRSRSPPVQEPVRAQTPEPEPYGLQYAFIDTREDETRSRTPPVLRPPRALSPQRETGLSRYLVQRPRIEDESRSRTHPAQGSTRAVSPAPEPCHTRYAPVVERSCVHEQPRFRTPVEVSQSAVSPSYEALHRAQSPAFEVPSRARSPEPEPRPIQRTTIQEQHRVVDEERPSRHATDLGLRHAPQESYPPSVPHSETERYRSEVPAVERARPSRQATVTSQSHPGSISNYPEYPPPPPPSEAPHRSKVTLPAPPFRSISPAPPPEFHVPPPPEEVLPQALDTPVIPETYVRNPPKRRPAQRAPSDAQSSTRSHERAQGRTMHERSLQSHASRRAENAPQHATQSSQQHDTAPPPPPIHDWMTSGSSTAHSHPYAPSSTAVSAESRVQTMKGGRPFLPPPKFDEFALPTSRQIEHASSLFVVSQDGIRVAFGSLFTDRKTIIIFIRHFWCAMCQDYMYSLVRQVDSKALERAGIDLVFIGCGSPAMIKSYSSIFRMPFSMYTDPSQRLYHALGMTRHSTSPGMEEDCGSYVRHGAVGGLAMVVRNALCFKMPVWERGGDPTQLGGEFIMGPGLGCSWVHRMTTTRNHTSIHNVLAAAGVPALSPSDPLPSGSTSEDAWSAGPSTSKHGTKPKRRTTEDEWAMHNLNEVPYATEEREHDVPGCWGRTGTKHVVDMHSQRYETERGRERQREQERDHDSVKDSFKGSLQLTTGRERSARERERTGRRSRDTSKGSKSTRTTPRRGFIVTNPDHDEDALPALPPLAHTRREEGGWESDGAMGLWYADEYGQREPYVSVYAGQYGRT